MSIPQSENLRGLFGLPHMTPNQFHQACEHEKLSYVRYLSQQPEKFKLGEVSKPVPFFVRRVSTFLRILPDVRTPICAFVVDDPFVLDQLGARLLGTEKIEEYRYRFDPIDPRMIRLALASCGSEPVTLIETPSVIDVLIKDSDDLSLLAPVQTLFYRIQDKEKRAGAQSALFGYLSGTNTERSYRLALNKNIDNDTVLTHFVNVIDNPRFKLLRLAAGLVREGKLTAEVAAEKYKIPVFDLRYCIRKTEMDNEKKDT